MQESGESDSNSRAPGVNPDRRVRIRKKRYRQKPRAWTEGVWVRNSFAALAIALVGTSMALYFSGKMPLLAAFFGSVSAAQNDFDRNTTSDGTGTRSLVEVVSASETDTRVIQGHLLASISGNKLTIVNEGTFPIRITRVVRNKRFGVAGCDTDADVNTDPNKPAVFANRVDQMLMLGENYSAIWSSACGSAGFVDVLTDWGTITFRLSPK